MRLLRAATLSVADPAATAQRYVQWFDYRMVDAGRIDPALAASWGAPRAAGRSFVTVAPSSGADIYLRFIAGEPVPGYVPLRTYGWAAIEICVQDVLAVNQRMRRSPFEIIGPPREIEGLPAIYPMQVRGPDQEIVYLTELRGDTAAIGLPRAAAPIDTLFILVLACSNLRTSLLWFQHHVRLTCGREMEIIYTMLARSFDLPETDRHAIATLLHQRDVFLELDQYPPAATPRPALDGNLPPGIAIATLKHPEFASLPGPWIVSPAVREGVMYGGAPSATMVAPDGVLVEIVAGA